MPTPGLRLPVVGSLSARVFFSLIKLLGGPVSFFPIRPGHAVSPRKIRLEGVF